LLKGKAFAARSCPLHKERKTNGEKGARIKKEVEGRYGGEVLGEGVDNRTLYEGGFSADKMSLT